MKLKYAAKVNHVRETSLTGVADLSPWQPQLTERGLAPIERDGRAELMLSAVHGRFRGIPFRERSFSIRARETETSAEGWFLAHAFSSLSFFAWVERTMFSAPYHFGLIASGALAPAFIEATADGGQIRAAMNPNATDRRPTRTGEESWHGPLFLPPVPGKPPTARKLFYASLSGDAQVFPFQQGLDSISITRCPKWPILAALTDANFVAVEWLLRPDASHHKSKTYTGPAQAVTW